MQRGQLSVSGIECRYDRQVAIKEMTFSLQAGEIACLLGPSGCGKSTTLRAIAGFENIHTGAISLDEREISSPRSTLPPEKRNIGMVFQDYALFPHLTVAANVEFGIAKQAKADKTERSEELLRLVNLYEYRDRFPHELSGGQQQRVALARALAPRPSLLLLDEPFSNLDTELRTRLSIDIRNILKELGISAIMVTHDQKEAFAMSDHIGVINDGKIQQWGQPFELYHEPVNRFVASFVGPGRFIPATSLNAETFECELGKITGNRAYPWETGTEVDLLIRPDDIIYDQHSALKGEIVSKTFAGTNTHYGIQLDSGTVIEASFPSHQDMFVGEAVNFALDAEHLIAYERAP